MTHDMRRFLRGWYGYAVLRELVPMYPLYAVMFTEHGITPIQLSILFAVWNGWAMLLEIPSGALADTYSRKWLLVMAEIVRPAGFVTWWLFPSFWGFLAGFIMWGTGSSLRSGTNQALLHDALEDAGMVQSYTKIYGRSRALDLVGCSLANITGGVLVYFGYGWVALGSAVFPLCAALVVATHFHEPAKHESLKTDSYWRVLVAGIHEAVTNPTVRFIVLLYTSLLILPGILEEYFGPLVSEAGYSRQAVPFLILVITLAATLGTSAAHRFHRVSIHVLFGLMCLAALPLFLLFVGTPWLAPMGIAFYYGVSLLVETAFAGHLQHVIRSESRATVTSVNMAVSCITGMGIYLAVGAAAEGYGMRGGAAFIAAVTIGLALVFSLLAKTWRISFTAVRDHQG